MTDEFLNVIDIILRKRDGRELSDREIEHFVRSVVKYGEAKSVADPAACLHSVRAEDTISEAQIGAMLMAIFQQGLSMRELATLTRAMRFSGETFSAKGMDTFTVDKHSTGGVGDKTSLLIAPVLAAAGLEMAPSISVPMISGRSLGHTGGTLDKLETIPGFNTQLTLPQMRSVLAQTHAALVGQTPDLVPADRVLYAMRDHTGTVESPFLICASIMSKKLAEDLKGLVLDVKVGSGAFMPTYEQSKFLAELMVSTGEASGTRTAALLTTMDEPLGRFSGNWIEVWECVDAMRGVRHPISADMIELSTALSGWMLFLSGKCETPAAGAQLADSLLRNGEAYAAWLRIVAAQGGDVSVFDNPAAFHKYGASRQFTAPRAGYVASMDCKAIGWAVQRLGAGRKKPEDTVSAHAGIESHAKIGAKMEAGQPIFTLFSEQEEQLNEPWQMIAAAVHISPEPPERRSLIQEVIFHAQR